jgi:hypothetical protein
VVKNSFSEIRSVVRRCVQYGLSESNSRPLIGESGFCGQAPVFINRFHQAKEKAGGRRCRPFPVTSQREEVLAGHPGEQREEVPLTGYSVFVGA